MGIETLARNLGLGALLSELKDDFGGYEMIHHWQRGEFHHDLLLRVDATGQASRAGARGRDELQRRRERGVVVRRGRRARRRSGITAVRVAGVQR